MTDELDNVLRPREPAAMSDAVRENMLTTSTRIVRRRGMIRRSRPVAIVAAVFVGGGAAGWFARPPVTIVETVRVEPQPAPVEQPAATPVLAFVSPRELELQAELSDDKVRAAQLYREAGDKYLVEVRDYAQAARCYRLHLNAAEPAEQKVASSDSWLLISMKSNLSRE